tara:strand:- start:93 stop:224 length:132 start_codon:yes stop_codon:yes gene_type:complete
MVYGKKKIIMRNVNKKNSRRCVTIVKSLYLMLSIKEEEFIGFI